MREIQMINAGFASGVCNTLNANAQMNSAQALAMCTGSRGVVVTTENRLANGELETVSTEHYGEKPAVVGNDFDRFAPTAEQIAYAMKCCADWKLDGVFVGINCPGKRYGVWMPGQEVNPIMDPELSDLFMVWEERSHFMNSLNPGDAVFRVYDDGLVGPAVEYFPPRS